MNQKNIEKILEEAYLNLGDTSKLNLGSPLIENRQDWQRDA